MPFGMVAIRHESEYKDNHGVKLTAVHNLEVARAAGCFQQLGQPFSVKADHCEDLPVEWAAGARHRPNAGATECAPVQAYWAYLTRVCRAWIRHYHAEEQHDVLGSLSPLLTGLYQRIRLRSWFLAMDSFLPGRTA